MASEELLTRIDRHIEHGNELIEHGNELAALNVRAFERNAEAFERNAEAFERNSEVLDRAIAVLDDQREFMRELTARSERSHANLMADMRRGFAEIHEGFADQRRALLAILDRLRPAPG
jgi:hypothetical protein